VLVVYGTKVKLIIHAKASKSMFTDRRLSGRMNQHCI